MLVLVLILVVIALVLLLAGWFLHLVVLAWTSVGISVLAGLVLLYDWWGTRAAVRAGRQTAGIRDGERDGPGGAATAVGAGAVGAGALGVGGGGSDVGGYGGADMEPATQVLPIVPAASNAPSNASEETMVMPVVAPSGESQAPSGVSRSSGLSSQSVTDARASDDSVEWPGDGATEVEPGGGDDPASGTARESGPEVAGAARGPDGGSTTAVTAAAAAGAVGSASTDGDDGTPATDARTTTGDTTTGDGATRVTQVQVPGAVDDPTSVAATHQPASDVDEQTRIAGQEAAQQPQQIDTSGEAPEEPHDATLTSLAARLPDEVVVIDERPRYHLQACPSLPGQPVIPLPVGEAVDLGFTPCAWCTPNRVLGERHPAEAR